MRLVGRVLDKPEVVFKYDATVDGNVPPVTPLVIAEPAVDPFGAILVPVVVPPVTSLVVVVSSLPQPLVATLVVSVAPLVEALVVNPLVSTLIASLVLLVMTLPAVEPLVRRWWNHTSVVWYEPILVVLVEKLCNVILVEENNP